VEKLSHGDFLRLQQPKPKKYDPNDPHFNPFHPPADTPMEVLKAFWGEDEEDGNNATKRR